MAKTVNRLLRVYVVKFLRFMILQFSVFVKHCVLALFNSVQSGDNTCFAMLITSEFWKAKRFGQPGLKTI